MTGVLVGRGGDTERCTHRRQPRGDRGTWEGCDRKECRGQRQEEPCAASCVPRGLGRKQPCQRLLSDFWLPAPGQQISVVLSHQPWGALLRLRQETDTGMKAQRGTGPLPKPHSLAELGSEELTWTGPLGSEGIRVVIPTERAASPTHLGGMSKGRQKESTLLSSSAPVPGPISLPCPGGQ